MHRSEQPLWGQEETPAPQQTALLFDQLVRDRRQRGRQLDAERLGSLEVDHKLVVATLTEMVLLL
jgi:hypothetical protein